MKIPFFTFLLFISGTLSAHGISEFQLKAALIVKMTHFIDWPEPDPDRHETNKSFSFCVEHPEETNIAFLQDWARSASIKNKPVEIVGVTASTADMLIKRCNILFITHSSNIPNFIEITRGSRVLTVSDTSGSAEAGVMINLFKENDRLQFEINLETVKTRQFRIEARLLKLARIVRAKQ